MALTVGFLLFSLNNAQSFNQMEGEDSPQPLEQMPYASADGLFDRPSKPVAYPANPEAFQRYLVWKKVINALRTPAGNPPSQPMKKRMCLINAGMSHGCDYKDLMGAMRESNFWNSASSPGKRKRTQSKKTRQLREPVAADQLLTRVMGYGEVGQPTY